MTTEDINTDPPTKAALRMRRHRQCCRKGLRSVRILLSTAEVEALVRRQYLADKERGDLAAVQFAAEAFINDALLEASQPV
jgi:hypothetical protein